MSDLDGVALSVEITLISLVEGFALQFLAGIAVPLLKDSSEAAVFPYLISAVLFTLIFWSQAVSHALSFIRWPIRPGHMLLYFIGAFTQVIAFGYVTDPVRWFFWCGVFSLVIGCLYVLDLSIIRDEKPVFERMRGGGAFIEEVEKRHRLELATLVPAALLFNLLAFLLLLSSPYFHSALWYAVFGVLQMMVSLYALVENVRNFRKRALMIGAIRSA